MSSYTKNLTARQFIEYIVRDYNELSHDKIAWQRDTWKRDAEEWLKTNVIRDESAQPEYCDCPVVHDGSCHEREVARLKRFLT